MKDTDKRKNVGRIRDSRTRTIGVKECCVFTVNGDRRANKSQFLFIVEVSYL